MERLTFPWGIFNIPATRTRRAMEHFQHLHGAFSTSPGGSYFAWAHRRPEPRAKPGIFHIPKIDEVMTRGIRFFVCMAVSLMEENNGC